MKARLVKLGELGTWGSGGTPLASRSEYYGGDIPWLIIEDLNDGFVEKVARKITRLGLENSSSKVVPPGTLLIAMYGSIGKLGITRIECATNQAIAYCKCDSKKVDTRFLFHLLLHERARFLRAGRGGTQQNINQEFLRGYEVSLPNLSEQQRITGQLEQADRLRRTRRFALELSNSFLPAAFASMFGSEAACLKRWPVARLDDCCHRITDGTHVTPEFLSAGVPFIFVKNIDNGSIDFRTDKFISDETHRQLYGRCPVEQGDVLYTIVGATYGQAVTVGDFRKFAFQRHIGHLKPDDQVVLPKFLAAVMQLPVVKTQADRWARGAAQPTINLKELKEFMIPVPPLPLQEQFAALVAQHERLRAVQRESLRQSEHLFQSLLHRAFAE